MPPTLETWDLAAEPITERSRLYCLEPIGIGTAVVESLSGYAERLAEAHAVSAGNLIGRELFVGPAASVITSKPAIHNHLKTGQRGLTQD